MGKNYKKRGWVKITRKEDGKNYKKRGWVKITRKEDG